jgi:outer membrane assembly lipoprotein YfiO
MKNKSVLVLVGVLFFAGCGKAPKHPEHMNFDELKKEAVALIDKKKDGDAIPFLERIIAQYPENQDIFEYKFMLADLYMKTGRLDEAYKLYKHYTKFYPAEVKAEDAHYKSILAKFYQTLKVSKDCDDTETKKALNRCKSYLKTTSYEKHRDEVKDIQYTCERRLIDKEVYVFNTYLKRKKYQSAQNRIEFLRKEYLPKHPQLEAQVLYLESALAHKQKHYDVEKQKVETLFDKFPESRFTKMAQNMITSKRKFNFF